MLKVASRKELDGLAGKRAPAVAAPPAAIVAAPAKQEPRRSKPAIVAPSPAPHPDMATMSANLTAISANLVRATELIARQARVAAPAVATPAAPRATGINLTVTRDKADRLQSVSFGTGRATVKRDDKHRMASLSIERAGKTVVAAIVRDANGRIERITSNKDGNVTS